MCTRRPEFAPREKILNEDAAVGLRPDRSPRAPEFVLKGQEARFGRECGAMESDKR